MDDKVTRKEFEGLKDRVRKLEDKRDTGTETNELLDRYDGYVIDEIKSVKEAHPRQLMALYEDAGIVDRGKRKQRAKRLKRVVDEQGDSNNE